VDRFRDVGNEPRLLLDLSADALDRPLAGAESAARELPPAVARAADHEYLSFWTEQYPALADSRL
jgi:hypothetical protein